jgi:hypothetical protein
MTAQWCCPMRQKFIWAHPESEKVCRSCAIVGALTGKTSNGDWTLP